MFAVLNLEGSVPRTAPFLRVFMRVVAPEAQ